MVLANGTCKWYAELHIFLSYKPNAICHLAAMMRHWQPHILNLFKICLKSKQNLNKNWSIRTMYLNCCTQLVKVRKRAIRWIRAGQKELKVKKVRSSSDIQIVPLFWPLLWLLLWPLPCSSGCCSGCYSGRSFVILKKAADSEIERSWYLLVPPVRRT